MTDPDRQMPGGQRTIPDKSLAALELGKRLRTPELIENEDAFQRQWIQEFEQASRELSGYDLAGEIYHHKIEVEGKHLDVAARNVLHRIFDMRMRILGSMENTIKAAQEANKLTRRNEAAILDENVSEGFSSWLEEHRDEILTDVRAKKTKPEILRQIQRIETNFKDSGDEIKQKIDRVYREILTPIYQDIAFSYLIERFGFGRRILNEYYRNTQIKLVTLAKERSENLATQVSHILGNVSISVNDTMPLYTEKMIKMVEDYVRAAGE